MIEKIDISYSQLYKLQLAFASLDNSTNVEEDIKSLISDDASQAALKWLYEHRRPLDGVSESDNVDLDSLDLQSETSALYSETKALKINGGGLDARELLAVNKLQMDMLSKLLDLHEKSKRHRQIGEFVEYIFNLLTDEQKEKVLIDFGGVYSESGKK